jgi:hypothetical protein
MPSGKLCGLLGATWKGQHPRPQTADLAHSDKENNGYESFENSNDSGFLRGAYGRHRRAERQGGYMEQENRGHV